MAMDGSKVPRHRLYGEAGKAAAGLKMQLRPYLSAGNPCPHLTGGTRATSGLYCSSSQCLKGQATPQLHLSAGHIHPPGNGELPSACKAVRGICLHT